MLLLIEAIAWSPRMVACPQVASAEVSRWIELLNSSRDWHKWSLIIELIAIENRLWTAYLSPDIPEDRVNPIEKPVVPELEGKLAIERDLFASNMRPIGKSMRIRWTLAREKNVPRTTCNPPAGRSISHTWHIRSPIGFPSSGKTV